MCVDATRLQNFVVCIRRASEFWTYVVIFFHLIYISRGPLTGTLVGIMLTLFPALLDFIMHHHHHDHHHHQQQHQHCRRLQGASTNLMDKSKLMFLFKACRLWLLHLTSMEYGSLLKNRCQRLILSNCCILTSHVVGISSMSE